MNEMMNKPMSVIRQEFIEQLVADINNCKLPLFVIEYILEDILDTVKATAKQQCEIERAQYEQLLKQDDPNSNNKE